jgi:hypothetical protein
VGNSALLESEALRKLQEKFPGSQFLRRADKKKGMTCDLCPKATTCDLCHIISNYLSNFSLNLPIIDSFISWQLPRKIKEE